MIKTNPFFLFTWKDQWRQARRTLLALRRAMRYEGTYVGMYMVIVETGFFF